MLPIMARMVRPPRGAQRKVYSLHELAVSCIAKGKAHKQDALGSKVSVASVGEPCSRRRRSFFRQPA
jgi:hypothetical protein